MAFGRQTDDTLVKPLGGAIVRRYNAGAVVEAGEAVYIDSNGAVQPTNAGAVATNFAIGVALQDVASGARVDVVKFGPVVCILEGTPGGIIYTTDTAGEPGTTAGTKKTVLGVAESATVLFVDPYMVDFV